MLYKHIDIPANKRVFIFGDIHGGFDAVKKVYDDLGIRDQDVKIFLGDTMDRGHQNFRCVMAAFREPNSYCILGNHEDMIVKGLIHNDKSSFHCWFANGGSTVDRELGIEGSKLMAEIVQHAPRIMTMTRGEKNFAFVHAEWPSFIEQYSPFEIESVVESFGERYRKTVETGVVWSRDLIECHLQGITFPPVKGVDYIFHGHTPLPEHQIVGNRVYMDTGAVFKDGYLTVAILEPDNHEIEDELIDGYMWFYSP